MNKSKVCVELGTKLGKQGKKDVVVPNAEVTKVYDGFADLYEIKAEGAPFATLLLNASDSVALIMLVEDNKGDYGIVTVTQRRYAMLSESNPTGRFTELTAGRTDAKKETLLDYVIGEALEETGVTVKEEDVVLLNGGTSLALSAGIMNERQWYVFVHVKSDQVQIVPEGHIFGAEDEGEAIVRNIVPLKDFLANPVEDMKLFFAKAYVVQFLVNKELENLGKGMGSWTRLIQLASVKL